MIARDIADVASLTEPISGQSSPEESSQSGHAGTEADSGLACLLLIASFHGIPAEAQHLRHEFGDARFSTTDILLAARSLGLIGKRRRQSARRWAQAPLPAIAVLADRTYCVVARYDPAQSGRLLVMHPGGIPALKSVAEFASSWSGELLYIAPKTLAPSSVNRFDFSWFIPAVIKYRQLLFEVLLISLILQIIGLCTPLFFQVVMDKVLVNHATSTLNVIAIGLLCAIVFDVVLSGIRSYVFAHTTSKLDVELGARLFRHLVSLPMAYFEARRVGDSVARIRELEQIRVFLTGNALTVAMDLAFSFIFMGVMFWYSPRLTLIVILSIPAYALLSLMLTPVLRARPEASGRRGGLPRISGGIEFDQVVFRYRPDGPEVLRDVSFSVAPGEVLGIVGRSGSGKSTITKLLQRLYVPERGRILVDGYDLATIEASSLRRQIGVVLQDNSLFKRTVRENIALSHPHASLEDVIRVAKLAGAHDFICALPEAYDTLVGENGAGLSGGERQRIAIARALLKNPRILILDEATSSLDYESERIIQDSMSRICQGRSVIIVAHRLSAVRDADRILVIDKGLHYSPLGPQAPRKYLIACHSPPRPGSKPGANPRGHDMDSPCSYGIGCARLKTVDRSITEQGESDEVYSLRTGHCEAGLSGARRE